MDQKININVGSVDLAEQYPTEEIVPIDPHTHADTNYNMLPIPHIAVPNLPSSPWVLLGKSVLSGAATAIGPIIFTGTYEQIHIEVFIQGLAGNSVGRLMFGGASIDTTGPVGNYACRTDDNGAAVTQNTLPGINLWNTAQSDYYFHTLRVFNQVAIAKFVTGTGSGSAHTSAGTILPAQIAGLWDNVTELIQRIQISSYTTNGSNVVGSNFNTGSYVIAWGKNNN